MFENLVLSNPPPVRGRRRAVSYAIAITGYAGLALAVIIVPLYLSDQPAPQTDTIRALLYDPPPPPPPPMPKGSDSIQKPKPHIEIPTPIKIPVLTQPTPTIPEEKAGIEKGSDNGTDEGMEGGVDGGQVGGVPGGVIGGVVGGTGDIPLDYDQPPRPIKITPPEYPADAFTKRIEGIVEVEILIGTDGHVQRARVVRSVPALDAAALQTVYRWVFAPAIKDGHPVATVARAPVSFRIY